MKIEQVGSRLKVIQNKLEELKEYGGIINEVEYDRENPEQNFKADNYLRVLDLLGDVDSILEWLEKPIVAEGVLVKNAGGRYQIDGTDVEFTSGRPLDVWHYDDWKEKEVWTRSRVEHGNGDYYIVALGKDVSIEGLKVRTR